VRDCSENPFLVFCLGRLQNAKNQKRLKRKARRRIFLAAARPNHDALKNSLEFKFIKNQQRIKNFLDK
jgi:hypothetical protein